MTTQEQHDAMAEQNRKDLELLAAGARVGTSLMLMGPLLEDVVKVWPEFIAFLEGRCNTSARALDSVRKMP